MATPHGGRGSDIDFPPSLDSYADGDLQAIGDSATPGIRHALQHCRDAALTRNRSSSSTMRGTPSSTALALDNLDLNELETTIDSLILGLAENGDELLGFVA